MGFGHVRVVIGSIWFPPLSVLHNYSYEAVANVVVCCCVCLMGLCVGLFVLLFACLVVGLGG